MDSAWIQRPVKLIQSDSDGVIIIQTDSDKFQKNSDRFSLIQNFLFMRVTWIFIAQPIALMFGGLCIMIIYEPPRGKTNNVVSEQVRHKSACTVTEKS